jgi:hypothetical protein
MKKIRIISLFLSKEYKKEERDWKQRIRRVVKR